MEEFVVYAPVMEELSQISSPNAILSSFNLTEDLADTLPQETSIPTYIIVTYVLNGNCKVNLIS